MVLRTLFVISLLLAGCSRSKTKVSEQPIDSMQVSSDSITKTETADTLNRDEILEGEKFEIFFEQFKSDSTFQIERVQFPFPSEVLDTDTDEFVKEFIPREKWRHLNFHYEENFATRDLDAYTRNFNIQSDKTLIEFRGVDNGIWIDFISLLSD